MVWLVWFDFWREKWKSCGRLYFTFFYCVSWKWGDLVWCWWWWWCFLGIRAPRRDFDLNQQFDVKYNHFLSYWVAKWLSHFISVCPFWLFPPEQLFDWRKTIFFNTAQFEPVLFLKQYYITFNCFNMTLRKIYFDSDTSCTEKNRTVVPTCLSYVSRSDLGEQANRSEMAVLVSLLFF